MTSALRLFQGSFGRVALLDSNQDLVTHSHPHCHVLVHADGAETAFRVRGERCPLTRDAMVLVNAWEPHAKEHARAHERSTVLALYIEPEWLAGLEPSLAAAAGQGFFPRPCVPMSRGVRRLADRLVGDLREGGRGGAWEADLSELMVAVAHEGSTWRSDAGVRGGRQDPRIARAISYMNAHLDGGISLAGLARECGLSRPHFFHLFRQCAGIPPALYLNALRMEAAFRRLPGAEEPIVALADSLGFSAPNHFTRFFRRNLGIPPSEYRRLVELRP